MKQIHARKEILKMLTKETHAAEKFPTPPNTFLMVRFKCCFSMNIISVIQFVVKFSLAFFIYLSDGESYEFNMCRPWSAQFSHHPSSLTPLKYTLFSHDGVRLRDVCSTSDTTYYTRQMKVKYMNWKTDSKFFHVNSLPLSFRNRGN